MKLREQIKDIGCRKINSYFVAQTNFPLVATTLAAKAFMEAWPEDQDTRALRQACKLLSNPGWISEDMEGVE